MNEIRPGASDRTQSRGPADIASCQGANRRPQSGAHCRRPDGASNVITTATISLYPIRRGAGRHCHQHEYKKKNSHFPFHLHSSSEKLTATNTHLKTTKENIFKFWLSNYFSDN
jgi:hypothetical protein